MYKLLYVCGMTRLYCLLGVIVIFFSTELTAQTEATSGFVVTNSNDTIRGIILNKDWDISPETIKFKTINDKDYKTYSAADIKAFSVDSSALYLGRTILLDISPIEVDKLIQIDINSIDLNKLYNDAYPPDTATRHVFIKELVRGSISLYCHRDATTKLHFFIQKKDSIFTELISRKYKSMTNSNSYSRALFYENQVWLYEKFRTQLKILMQECPSLSEKIDRVTYNEEELADLIIAYNNCLQQPSQVLFTRRKSKLFKVALAAGIFTSDITFTGQVNLYDMKDADFSPYSNVSAGFSFVLFLEKRFHRHNIVNDVLWKRLKFDGSFEEADERFGLPLIYHRDYHIDISYIKLNTIYRYYFFSSKKTKLFMEAGWTNAWAMNMEATLHQEERILNNAYKTQATIFERKHEEGFIVSVGGYYHGRYGLKFSYERSNGMSDYDYFDSTINSYSLFFNYMLGKPE